MKKIKKNTSLNASFNTSKNLIKSGVLGEKAKTLYSLKDKTDTPEYFYKALLSMYEKPEKIYGIKNTIELTYTFIEIIAESQIVNGSQVPIDVLTSIWRGTASNPSFECFSAYLDFVCAHKSLEKPKNIEFSQLEKYNYSTLLLSTYAKGVELINKFLIFIITLLEKIDHIEDHLEENSKLSLFKKINKFLELSDGKYDKLANIVDRKIRNAYSHSNFTPNFVNDEYIFQNNGKEFTVSFEEMIFKVYPQINWFISAFIGATYLLVLVNQDINLYKMAINHINDLNKRSDLI